MQDLSLLSKVHTIKASNTFILHVLRTTCSTWLLYFHCCSCLICDGRNRGSIAMPVCFSLLL